MNKKELKKIEDKIKLHKHNKCKLSIIEFEIDVNDNITMNRKWKIKMYKNDH